MKKRKSSKLLNLGKPCLLELGETSETRNIRMDNNTERKIYTWKEIVQNIHSPYNTYVFVSMRNSGKSKSIRNLVVELMCKVPHHNIVLFSTTAFHERNDDYNFLKESPYAKIFPGDKESIEVNVQKILDHCDNMKRQNKKSEGEETHLENTSSKYNVMVIFDDIDITKKNDKVAELFTQGRHSNLSIIVSSQNASYFLSPTIRTNIDYLAFRKVENTYKKTLWNMCNTKMTFTDFKDFVDENTTDYKFILYDNTSQGKDDKERIKIVKSVLYKDMKMKMESRVKEKNI
jgi:hypothetical protein